jgi:nitrite reductase/ring-hydroxylating ferredoxin subunit
MQRIIKFSLLLIVVTLLLPGGGCKKETVCNGVPNTAVNFSVNLNLGYPQLNPVNGNATYSGGYANHGVLIYHYLTAQFVAYDCTCPYDGESNGNAVISAKQGALFATCPVCGSSFLLSSGSPNKGPSTCPLKAYSNTTYDQTNNIVYVSN